MKDKNTPEIKIETPAEAQAEADSKAIAETALAENDPPKVKRGRGRPRKTDKDPTSHKHHVSLYLTEEAYRSLVSLSSHAGTSMSDVAAKIFQISGLFRMIEEADKETQQKAFDLRYDRSYTMRRLKYRERMRAVAKRSSKLHSQYEALFKKYNNTYDPAKKAILWAKCEEKYAEYKQSEAEYSKLSNNCPFRFKDFEFL